MDTWSTPSCCPSITHLHQQSPHLPIFPKQFHDLGPSTQTYKWPHMGPFSFKPPQIVQLVLMEDLSLAMFSRTFLLFFIMTVHVNIYSLTPQSCQELWSFSLLVIAILTAVRYKVKTILICIFLMKKDIKHLNTYLWSISFSSFEDSVQFDRTLEGSVFETGTLYLSLLSQNLVHRPGCPEAHAVLLASAIWLLGLQVCSTMDSHRTFWNV